MAVQGLAWLDPGGVCHLVYIRTVNCHLKTRQNLTSLVLVTMPFDFYARQVFLTYSQIGDKQVSAFCDFFRLLNHPIEKFVVGLEEHQDGGRHIHVYGVFADKFRTRRERFWDWDGVHPNIKVVRGKLGSGDARRVYEYVTKDGNVTVWPEDAEFKFGPVDRGAKYRTVLSASSKEEALSLVREELPRDYLLNLERIEYTIDRVFRPVVPVYESPFQSDSFAPCPVIQQWAIDNLGYVSGLVVFSGAY